MTHAQANGAARRAHAPNWNFNVSPEGDFVVLASEPLCVCGVDVAAPGQLRCKGATAPPPMREYVQLFRRQLTPREVERILGAGCEGVHTAAKCLLTRVCPSETSAATSGAAGRVPQNMELEGGLCEGTWRRPCL